MSNRDRKKTGLKILFQNMPIEKNLCLMMKEIDKLCKKVKDKKVFKKKIEIRRKQIFLWSFEIFQNMTLSMYIC